MLRRLLPVLTPVTVLVLTAFWTPTPNAQRLTPNADSRVLFERRILPIFKAKNPSSCSECHLSGVDLKDYIRPSEALTYASLRDSGLINVRQPEQSGILRLIKMSSPKSSLVQQKVRTAEYD